MPEFIAYSVGIVSASVCSSLSPEETADRLNRECPTGISSPWQISSEAFRTGEPNPCPCEDAPATHKHYLFSC